MYKCIVPTGYLRASMIGHAYYVLLYSPDHWFPTLFALCSPFTIYRNIIHSRSKIVCFKMCISNNICGPNSIPLNP